MNEKDSHYSDSAPALCAILVSGEVYRGLEKLSSGWGQTVDEYTNRCLKAIMFPQLPPASAHPFAFNAFIHLTKGAIRK